MIEWIERLQRELAAMRDYRQGYLDRRARTGITTKTDTIMADHQRTLAETLDLLEAIGKWRECSTLLSRKVGIGGSSSYMARITAWDSHLEP